jgi:hypothetical protein
MARQGGFANWQELRDHAIDLFGETPHPLTEQEIIAAYELHPDAVENVIQTTGVDVKAGRVRSGWGITRSRAATIAAPPSNPDRPTGIGHGKMIARAEQRIRTTGPHINRESEMLDDLFGDRGMFKDHKPDELTTKRLMALWHEQQPIGAALEAEAEERARAWVKAHTFKRRAHLAAAYPEPATSKEPA